MLDIIARLEAVGVGTSFEMEDAPDEGRFPQSTALAPHVHGVRAAAVAMTCLIMTPDGGETEPQNDQPDQDDDGKQDEDDSDAASA